MRYTGDLSFFGGAEQTQILDTLRGDQYEIELTITDGEDPPSNIDAEQYSATAVAEFYKVDVTITGRGDAQRANITRMEEYNKTNRTLAIRTAGSGTSKKFYVQIPEDLAEEEDTADVNATEGVLLAGIYFRTNNGETFAVKQGFRIGVLVRHSV